MKQRIDDNAFPYPMPPFTLSMPDNRYWTVGDGAGKAWSAGAGLRKTQKK